MRNKLTSWILVLSTFILIGCAQKYNKHSKQSTSTFPIKKVTVSIEPIITDSLLNVRAIEVVNLTDSLHGLVYLTSRGEIGSLLPRELTESGLIDASKIKLSDSVSYMDVRTNLSNDTLKLNFRALAIEKNKGYGITIGSPALLYALDIDYEKNKIVYREDHEKAFYDSMEFWNDNEGLAIGDPTEECMSILITRDGGLNWTKLNCDQLPRSMDGEAAFAASDTNISIVGDHTWVATGGKSSRILYSPDKGHSWQVYDTPIIQGKETTGIYSIDFYDELNGFGIGGDYTDPDGAVDNKIRSNNNEITCSGEIANNH